MSGPLVSVVMAAYNGAALIGETLRSLAAQTMTDFEVIVVDDGSTDATREIVGAWPGLTIRLFAQGKNGGPVLARNRGVGEARGRYIAALDQDDLCRPGRFAAQIAYLEAHPAVVLLGTEVEFLKDGRIGPSNYVPATTPDLLAWLTAIENPIVWSSVMLRTDAARALHPFTRPELVYAEDFDLYQRIRPLGTIARLDEPLTVYRQHAGGISKRFVATMRDSAARVLAERHAALYGGRAAEVARLLVLHVMGGMPVPDRATLLALGEALATIQANFLRHHRCDAESLRLIRWETAQRWGRIGRAGLRAGTLSLADVLAVRPDHLGLGYAGVDELLWSGAIGAARRAAAR